MSLKEKTRSRSPVKGPQTLDLFEFAARTPEPAASTPPVAVKQGAPRSDPKAQSVRKTRNTAAQAIVVRVEDLPPYPDDLHEAVDSSLASLPREEMWLTYRAIGKYFGISRATIARRVKDGLVPGVRFENGRVQGDAAVRRFDRAQLKYLLLAVRYGRQIGKH